MVGFPKFGHIYIYIYIYIYIHVLLYTDNVRLEEDVASLCKHDLLSKPFVHSNLKAIELWHNYSSNTVGYMNILHYCIMWTGFMDLTCGLGYASFM